MEVGVHDTNNGNGFCHLKKNLPVHEILSLPVVDKLLKVFHRGSMGRSGRALYLLQVIFFKYQSRLGWANSRSKLTLFMED